MNDAVTNERVREPESGLECEWLRIALLLWRGFSSVPRRSPQLSVRMVMAGWKLIPGIVADLVFLPCCGGALSFPRQARR